jgi:hypothetical protein
VVQEDGKSTEIGEREREREREMRRWHQDGGWFKFVFGFYYEVGLR